MSDIRTELEHLRASLVTRPAAELVKAVGKAEPPPEIEAMLGELRDAIADAAEDAGKAVAAHPALALGAAFLLGLMVGRVSGRL
jgi:hypothetical protein